MEKRIRWGILGTGKIAKALATALKELPDAELAAVASRSIDSATSFAKEYGAKRAHGSYQALADDPDVDVIYIATPHPMHHENALMCLNAGKALLVEKAFTVNRREAEEVVALARKKKLFVMEAMWSRFQPALVEAKRLIEAGEIGKITNIQADLGFMADVGPEHRLFNKELGGGAMLDLGIYPLSVSTYFLGGVASVKAMSELGPTGVDVQTNFVLRHVNGGLSSCATSLTARTGATLSIGGSKGFLRLLSRFHHSEDFVIELNDGSRREVHVPRIGNGYVHEMMEVQRCLRAGLLESPVMPLNETLALMSVMDDIRAQAGVRYAAD
jgi:predicted dehydrogenase